MADEECGWNARLGPMEDVRRTQDTDDALQIHDMTKLSSLAGPRRRPEHFEQTRAERRADLVHPLDAWMLDEHERIIRLGSKTHKERQAELDKLRIMNHPCDFEEYCTFLMVAAKALLMFGSPSYRVEQQLGTLAAVMHVDLELTLLPTVVIASFGAPHAPTSTLRVLWQPGGLTLGKLQDVCGVYRAVLHDEISAVEGTTQIEVLVASPPEYPLWANYLFTFALAALVCPLGFGGSFLDLWLSGTFAVFIKGVKWAFVRSRMYATTFEVLITIIVSFTARFASDRPHTFCYNAVASAGIVCILPGWLVLTASLELASKAFVSGAVHMVWALVYALFLGFALQIGSEAATFFLSRARLDTLHSLSGEVAPTVEIIGHYVARAHSLALPANASIEFTPAQDYLSTDDLADWVNGCSRPANSPWYAREWPKYHLFWLVPTFAFVNTLACGQPLRRTQTAYMVLCAIAAWTANYAADIQIFEHTDVVSSIGAFTCAVLGTAYARKRRVPPFVVIVPGVLFLVPSGLAFSGGVTAEPDVITLGHAMISTSIGISCGIFAATAIAYCFGGRSRSSFTF